MPIFDEVTSMPLSEKLGLLKSEYPEQKEIAAETPTEYLRSDRADFGDGPLGNVLTYLAPGGRSIVRGGAQMIDSALEAQKALAAVPRVYLGANPITIGMEKGFAGPAFDQLQEFVKPAAEAPLAS